MAPPPPPSLHEVFFCAGRLTLEPDVRLRFFKKGKWSELNFRNFWPGSRHLRPFPDRPDRPARLTLEPDVGLRFLKKGKWSELNFRKFWPGSRHLRPFPDCPDPISSLARTQTVLGGIQVVSCAARPLTLRVASGYRGGVFFDLTRDW